MDLGLWSCRLQPGKWICSIAQRGKEAETSKPWGGWHSISSLLGTFLQLLFQRKSSKIAFKMRKCDGLCIYRELLSNINSMETEKLHCSKNPTRSGSVWHNSLIMRDLASRWRSSDSSGGGRVLRRQWTWRQAACMCCSQEEERQHRGRRQASSQLWNYLCGCVV